MAIDIVRAWKDPEYRKTLSAEELASLPPNPAGSATLSDEDLAKVAGGSAAISGGTAPLCTLEGCCVKLPSNP